MSVNDTIIIVCGVLAGMFIGTILVNMFLGLPTEDDKDNSTPLDFKGLPRGECSQHKWGYDISKHLYCKVCKKKPS